MTGPGGDAGAAPSGASLWSWLTQREREVLDHVAMGMSAKTIAQTLSIAPRTVERHIDHIRLKTRTRNRAHMVALAIASGCMADGKTAGGTVDRVAASAGVVAGDGIGRAS